MTPSDDPPHGRLAVLVDPDVELVRVEVQDRTPFDVRDASLGDEPADVADGDAEVLGGAVDVEQRTTCRHELLLSERVNCEGR